MKSLTYRLRRLLGRTELVGHYPTWDAAAAASAPYQTDCNAARQQADRHAREGVPVTQRSWAITGGFLLAAAKAKGALTVLDFGGGLGTHFWQVQPLLKELAVPVTWHVIELPDMVECGQAHYQSQTLRFQTAADGLQPDLVLAAGVLQYLPDPYATLRSLLASRPAVVVLDRTPVAQHPDQFCIQRAPSGSRPLRVLSDAQLTPLWSPAYQPVLLEDTHHRERFGYHDFAYLSAVLERR